MLPLLACLLMPCLLLFFFWVWPESGCAYFRNHHEPTTRSTSVHGQSKNTLSIINDKPITIISPTDPITAIKKHKENSASLLICSISSLRTSHPCFFSGTDTHLFSGYCTLSDFAPTSHSHVHFLLEGKNAMFTANPVDCFSFVKKQFRHFWQRRGCGVAVKHCSSKATD